MLDFFSFRFLHFFIPYSLLYYLARSLRAFYYSPLNNSSHLLRYISALSPSHRDSRYNILNYLEDCIGRERYLLMPVSLRAAVDFSNCEFVERITEINVKSIYYYVVPMYRTIIDFENCDNSTSSY